jgi:AMMECR1 domain-containing protein
LRQSSSLPRHHCSRIASNSAASSCSRRASMQELEMGSWTYVSNLLGLPKVSSEDGNLYIDDLEVRNGGVIVKYG